ncbi:EfeM/EfeO family lipoprotein [Streptomyces odontomachi]|uniref:EfeM/EfeO family lipoprotein n=1 Tax=Streptomyces odontomachi TaxID=2944940 RepID=UPI00210D47BD|nr:EfeM/EfeO family lipoprotein [Streptomyces sp. ODS25]
MERKEDRTAEAPAEAAADPPERRRWYRHRRWALSAGALVLAAASFTTVVLVTGADGARTDDRAGAATRIDISLGSCGGDWTGPHPGTQVFELRSTMNRATEVHLVNARTGAVYGEIEGLGPGTTRRMTASLGAGTYRFQCLPDDAPAAMGPVVHITGAGHAGQSGVVPVNQHDLIPPTLDYQKWIGERMSDLVDTTDRLRTAVHDGDRAKARTAWLAAHLVYERMGAAYGTFGDADEAINGTDAGLPRGVHDPGFTGFHRLEQGLWHGESTSGLRPIADRLDKDVRALRDSWAEERMDPLDMGLRAHEILENTLQFELTGRTDHGSGSNLATARANLDGTKAVLTRLRPLLRTRYPHLARLDDSLHHLGELLDAQHHGTRWTPLDRLSRAERQAIDAATGDAVERLADIAAICDVRRTA